MAFRDWMNNNSAVVTLLAVVVLVISLGVILMNSTRGRNRTGIIGLYYYDLGTKKIFVDKSDRLPPFETETGTGVRAFVFSCDKCGGDYDGMTVAEVEAAGAHVSYLQKYHEEARKHLLLLREDPTKANPAMMEMADRQYEIRAVDSDRWMGVYSPVGLRLRNAYLNQCGDSRPKVCQPK